MSRLKLLIVSATSLEISPLLAQLNTNNNQPSFPNLDIHTLLSGVGITATAFSLGKALTESHYDFVLNLGIAGAFNRDLQLGQNVWVQEETFPEMGAESPSGFLSIFDLGLVAEAFPFNNRRLRADPLPFQLTELESLTKVSSITVNTVSGIEQTINQRKLAYEPDIESMEGGAFMYAVKMSGVTFAQVRCISNYVEPRNRDNWKLNEAVNNLNHWAIGFLQKLNEE